MKTQEELNALKEEVQVLNKKLNELTDEELTQVVGGFMVETDGESSLIRTVLDFFFKINK